MRASYSLNPLGILESSGDSAGFSDRWNDGGEAISWVGFEDDIFKAGLHGMKVKGGGGGGGGGGRGGNRGRGRSTR